MSHQNPSAEDDPFAVFFTAAENSPGYWLKLAKLEFTEQVLTCMKEMALTKSKLADLLKVKPSMVTRIVNGHSNFELATMVKIARALGCEFRSHLQRPSTRTIWKDFLNEEPTEDDEAQDWESQEYQTSKTLAVAA